MSMRTRYDIAIFTTTATSQAREESGSGKEALVHGAQVPARHVRVNLGRSDVRVPQHGLHGAQVRAALDEVRGERVPQLVRRDPLANPRGHGVAPEQLPEPLSGHGP